MSERLGIGRLTYPTPPPVGTVIGPEPVTGRNLVVIAHEDGKAVVDYTTREDYERIFQTGAEINSPTEHEIYQSRWWFTKGPFADASS